MSYNIVPTERKRKRKKERKRERKREKERESERKRQKARERERKRERERERETRKQKKEKRKRKTEKERQARFTPARFAEYQRVGLGATHKRQAKPTVLSKARVFESLPPHKHIFIDHLKCRRPQNHYIQKKICQRPHLVGTF